MDDRQIARILALSRAAVGVSAVVAPGLVGRRWVGPVGAEPGAKLMTRAFGARDAALGVGLHQALQAGEPAGDWIRAGMAADAVDAAATLVAIRRVGWKSALPVLLVALAAAILGVRLSATVD